MGKAVEETVLPSSASETPADSSVCCSRSTWRWLLSLTIGAYVLMFALWWSGFWNGGESSTHGTIPTLSMPHIEASFRLHKSAATVNASFPQLQLDLQNEIGMPGTQVHIVEVYAVSSNWTEVLFRIFPLPSNNSIPPAELSLLKDTFVELFLQQSENLSLTEDVFGNVYHFEVVHFPGGITVVPQQPGFPLSKVTVLFNFTLHNSLSHIISNFVEFRQQLANGITLKPNENLFVQLTNVEGSTIISPVVVQTSILPVVGAYLPSKRLKQLAQEITSSPPRRNLGLNHTLFGRVKEIHLSSYLQYILAPAQAPAPSPGPSQWSGSSSHNRGHGNRKHHHHHHHHHRRNSALDLPPSSSPTPEPQKSFNSPSASSPNPLSSAPPQSSLIVGYTTPPVAAPSPNHGFGASDSIPIGSPASCAKIWRPSWVAASLLFLMF